MTKSFVWVFALVLAAACAEPAAAPDAGPASTDAPYERVVGYIKVGSEPVDDVIRAPAVVGVGSLFMIEVRTVGGGCVIPESLEVTAVAGEPATLEAVPYDRVYASVGSKVCPVALVSLVHTAWLSFATPGRRMLRVRGRALVPRDLNVFVAIDRAIDVVDRGGLAADDDPGVDGDEAAIGGDDQRVDVDLGDVADGVDQVRDAQ